MSGLFDALARGISQAGYAAGDLFSRQALAETQAQIEAERETRLAEFRTQLALRLKAAENQAEDQQRQQQVERIDKKAGEMADQAVAGTRGLIEAGIQDRSAWTPEHQAAVDQSLTMQRGQAKDRLRTKAAIATGDISPKDVANMEGREEAALLRAELERERQNRIDQRQEDRLAHQSAENDKRFTAMLDQIDRRAAARGQSDDSVRAATAYLDSKRKNLDDSEQTVRARYQAELKSAVGPTARKEVENKFKPEFDELKQQRRELDEMFEDLRERAGFKKRGAAAAPSPAPERKPTAGKTSAGTDNGNSDSPAAIINQEYRKTRERLAQATDPVERKRLEGDISALQAEAKRGGFALNDTAPAKASRTSTETSSASPYRVGETRVVQAGPHKGKTAVWDGQGWKLR